MTLLMIKYKERRSGWSFQKKIEIQYAFEKVEEINWYQILQVQEEKEKQFAQTRDWK